MRRTSSLLKIALAAALVGAGGAQAASIAGDDFAVDVVVDDGGGGTVPAGPFSGVAGGVADDIFSSPDLLAFFTAGSTDYEVRINWIDADSFDLFFVGFGAVELNSLSITVSGLDFRLAGQPVDIVGAAFNRAASNVDSYQAGPQMPDPGVSFTAHSVTAAFSYFPSGLVADGPILRFDVQPALVPEPASFMLLAGGLAALGAVRRRLKPRSFNHAAGAAPAERNSRR